MMMYLKGRNLIGRFRKAAERLVSEIAESEGVAGIVVGGGLERGFADRYSDIDILVFLRKKKQVLKNKLLRLSSEAQKALGFDVDLEVHFLEDFKKPRINEMQMWDLCHMQVVFDPQGEVKRLLRQKTKVPRSFWTRKIVVCSEYLKWYCCPPREDVGTIAEAWVERGDIMSAHYCANYGLDLIVDMLYALNREFVPPPKWKLFYSYGLRWLPSDYRRLLREALRAHAFSEEELTRRLSSLRRLWQDILPKIEEETGLTRSSMSKYFVEKVLHQTQLANAQKL
jgi:predicted nucleotidyltransferase